MRFSTRSEERPLRAVHRVLTLCFQGVRLLAVDQKGQSPRSSVRRDLQGVRRADGHQDGTLRRVPGVHDVSQVQVHPAGAARYQVPQVQRRRSRGTPHQEGQDVLRLPALPGLRLFHLEQTGPRSVSELRIRGHGRDQVQDDGRNDTQVSEVRTHDGGGGVGPRSRRGDDVGAQHAAPLHTVVVGGGLAGCEAAWALAERGVRVTLHEMRPVRMTPAHETEGLAELVCSNTFKSVEPTHAHGLLKAEMRQLGSIVLEAADAARIPGGSALAVDRVVFSKELEARVLGHGNITIVRGEVTDLPSPGIIATGPLTSDALAAAIAARLGVQSLAFFDAIAPIVSADSLDYTRLFKASRYGKGGGDDYWNAPFTKAEYETFVAALLAGEQYVPGHEWDKVPYFEGCLPVEEMAQRGPETLRFGPMKPVGLVDPRAGARGQPYAVVQLRQEDRAAQMWNLVGFQTRLKTGAQQRILRTIPGLEHAEFLRYGSIHRNSYLNAPQALTPYLSALDDPQLLFAGQLTGVEGYTESAATGLLAGINLARLLAGDAPLLPPPTTMLGALYRYLRETEPARFQPMNANFGLMEPLDPPVRDKFKKKEALAERALREIGVFAQELGVMASA